MLSYETFESLYNKNIYGGMDVSSVISDRLDRLILLPLFGISEERIVFVNSDEIMSMVDRLSVSMKNARGTEKRDVLILEGLGSATIEGARTTVENVKKAISANPKTNDDKMVVNTIKALNKSYKIEVTEGNISVFWKEITNGICENAHLQGSRYRKGMVYVGNSFKIIHTPEKPENIPRRISDLFAFLNNKKYNSLLSSIIAHFYFVYIHPMCDGNGRLARLIQSSYLYWNWDKNVRRIPVSSVLSENSSFYYKAICDSEKAVNLMNERILDVTPFIVFMLNIIEESILRNISLSDVEKLLLSKVHKNYEITSKKASVILHCTVDESRGLLNALVDKGFFIKSKVGTRNVYKRV